MTNKEKLRLEGRVQAALSIIREVKEEIWSDHMFDDEEHRLSTIAQAAHTVLMKLLRSVGEEEVDGESEAFKSIKRGMEDAAAYMNEKDESRGEAVYIIDEADYEEAG
jgi:hypothetical protein